MHHRRQTYINIYNLPVANIDLLNLLIAMIDIVKWGKVSVYIAVGSFLKIIFIILLPVFLYYLQALVCD